MFRVCDHRPPLRSLPARPTAFSADGFRSKRSRRSDGRPEEPRFRSQGCSATTTSKTTEYAERARTTFASGGRENGPRRPESRSLSVPYPREAFGRMVTAFAPYRELVGRRTWDERYAPPIRRARRKRPIRTVRRETTTRNQNRSSADCSRAASTSLLVCHEARAQSGRSPCSSTYSRRNCRVVGSLG